MSLEKRFFQDDEGPVIQKKMSDMITIFAELFHNLPALTFSAADPRSLLQNHIYFNFTTFNAIFSRFLLDKLHCFLSNDYWLGTNTVCLTFAAAFFTILTLILQDDDL